MKQKGFTLIELLVVVAIIGILAAVGVVAYNGYTKSAKKNAIKANHKQITKLIGANIALCNTGGDVQYLNIDGETQSFSCPDTIDNFINYMNQTIYGMKMVSPAGTKNPSWCRVNVTNCSPPGYMSGCPSNPDQIGYLSVFKQSSNQIKICTNLEYSNGIIYIEDILSFE
tara:strand:- start:687 stop:1196 length:510 start_codon:yes stop_codon:yes gene_type:complete